MILARLFHVSKPRVQQRLNWKGSFLNSVLVLSMSLWLSLTLEDWLLSSANPYPYLESVSNTVGVGVGFVLLLLVRRPSWWLLSILSVGILGLTVFGLTATKASLIFFVAILGVSAVTLFLGFSAQSENNRFPRSMVSKNVGLATKYICFALLFFVGLYLIWREFSLSDVLSATMAHTGDASWLGQGVSTFGKNNSDTFGLLLMKEQGFPIVLVLAFTTVCAMASGVVVLVHSQDFPNRLQRVILSAIGLGAIYSLLLVAPDHAPFETTNSVRGTWVLALAVASLGIAAAPEHQVKQRQASLQAACDTKRVNDDQAIRIAQTSSKTQLTKTPRKNTAVYSWLGCFATLLAAVTFLHYSFFRQVLAKAQGPVAVPLAAVSTSMQDATVAMEDGYFYNHHGFDWIAMHRALRVDLREGRVEQGGSTLTQQLAKNLFLSNDRTLWRKLQEAGYTAELEHDLPKHRILELYLNTIDYGMGQHGIKAAAAYYFHKTPDRLTLPESAILVGLVPRPPQTPSEFNDGRLSQGERTALGRIAFFFPHRYSQAEVQASERVPLDHLIYPDKDALDRGATDIIPATWHGVNFFFYASPDDPGSIDHVSSSLKPALAAFLDEAHWRYGLTGLDHLGVYNDRPMRQSQTSLSAHAFGQAIDVSGFRFKNGSHISVKDYTDPKIAARLAPLEVLLKKHFPIVVDWRDDPLRHQTHFHCEVLGPRNAVNVLPAANPQSSATSSDSAFSNSASNNVITSRNVTASEPDVVMQPAQRLHERQQGHLVH